MLSSDEIQLAYLAGFFDGEGSIIIRQSHTIYLGINVTQCDPRPLHLFAERFGGAVSVMHDGVQWRRSYIWQIGSHNAAAALEALLPYLTVKRDQALLAIEFQRLIPAPGSKNAAETWDQRLQFMKAVHDLKKISYELDGSEIEQPA